jgi:RHS repeat-associated protein
MPPRCSRITHSRPFADKQCPALFICKRMRYDPWGKPQAPLGSKTRAGDRGFTGHEHLAGGLIHMNGRIYDPVLGRFLSADIVVQFPDAITSYNRYAYVMNNPMAYTDPSGYFIQFIIAAYASIASTYGIMAMISAIAFDAGLVALATGHKTAARKFFAAALTFATAGTQYAVLGAFAAGGIQSGSVEGAVMAAFSAAFFQMAGELSDLAMANDAANVAGGAPGEYAAAANASAFSVGGIGRAGMHFGAGAMRAMITGADPLRSGMSAGFAEVAGPWASAGRDPVTQFAAHVVAGGIGEAIGGGKFKNGAMTAAFAWLYNHWFSKSDTAKMYRSRKGHHQFTKEWVDDPIIGKRLSPEAVDYAAYESNIGGHVKWEGNHPNKYSHESGHIEYSKGSGRQTVLQYMEKNGITEANPMTKSQMVELVNKLSTHPFNISVQEYVRDQVRQGNVLMGRSAARGTWFGSNSQ